jgi:uncharacterized protein (DUF1800 family)
LAEPQARAALRQTIHAATELPPLSVIALNRAAFGPVPGDIAALETMGFPAWVEQQLHPADLADTICDARIEARNFTTLGMTVRQLWTRYRSVHAWEEQTLPFREVRDATWIRAVYSRRQLQEVLVDFWHNHFNVSATSEEAIAAVFPDYDRVIRSNCFGNFRIFLEDIASSPAMLRYLSNMTSRDGPSNENYARELFELHTLGSDHYYNALYDNVSQVPRDTTGLPLGYIDMDIYEAADCFTGWTIANGAWDGESGDLPDTGEFLYYQPWHDDRFSKIVLSTDGRPNIIDPVTPLADGRRVLDILAAHPATADHLCRKLCRRLVADEPPQSLVDRAVATWSDNLKAPDQMRRVVRTILLAPEFAATWGAKTKRPLELFASFLRATAADFVPNDSLHWVMQGAGQRLFEWPTPNGHPDTAEAWINPNTLQHLWNAPLLLLSDWFKAANFDLPGQIPASAVTSTEIVDFWLGRMLGRPIAPADRTEIIDFLRQSRLPDEPPQPDPPTSTTDLPARIEQLVALIAMTPDYLQR